MQQKRALVSSAAYRMLIWFAFYLLTVFYAAKWAAFLSVVGCLVPVLLFSRKGETFGSRDCNTVKYKKKQYALFFVFTVSGSALLAFLGALAFSALGGTLPSAAGGRSDLLYLVVFSCLLPAFFEELLLRGSVLGALSPLGGAGVILCGLLFALMHIQLQKLPYALFAGILITALVYLTECIYLGMLLHLFNNLTALFFARIPAGQPSYIAAGILLLLFLCSFAALRKTKLFTDLRGLVNPARLRACLPLITPAYTAFIAGTLALGILYLV